MIKTGVIPNTSATRISLVRHAGVHNPSYIFYGRLPGFSISAQGRYEAARAAQALKRLDIAAVFASPLLRCRQTASEILTYHPGLNLHRSTLITEVHTPFQGQPAAAVDARNGDVYTGADSNYEQPEDILNRIQKFFLRTRAQFPGKHVIAVTHGDVVLFALLWANDFPASVRYKQAFTTLGLLDEYPAAASVTTFCYATGAKEERPSMAYFNPMIHLPS